MQRHILLIDDEPYFRFGIELALRKRGYRVSQVSDGEDALQRILGDAADRPPLLDLILLDLELPTLHGAEIMRRLHEEAVATPVMIFSGFFNALLYQEVMRLGCLELLFKPVREQMLQDRIERALKQRRLRQ